MKIHRFYNDYLKFDDVVEINKKEKNSAELFNQMYNVLKLEKEEIVQFFYDSVNYNYKIVDVNNKNIELKFLEKLPNKIDKDLNKRQKINLYIANIKKDKIEWCAEKAVELGVSSLNILLTERTQNKIINIERLEKIIKEATEQSGRGNLMCVRDIKNIKEILEYTNKNENRTEKLKNNLKENKDKIQNLRIDNIERLENEINILLSIPDEYNKLENNNKIKEILENDNIKNINLFIGPEGGWTEVEEKEMQKANFEKIFLGETVLRAETAAIAGIAKFI